MTTAEIKEKILNDVVFMGLRSAIGVIFILHGMMKFNPGFAENLPNMGLPPEMQIPIALAEVGSRNIIDNWYPQQIISCTTFHSYARSNYSWLKEHRVLQEKVE